MRKRRRGCRTISTVRCTAIRITDYSLLNYTGLVLAAQLQNKQLLLNGKKPEKALERKKTRSDGEGVRLLLRTGTRDKSGDQRWNKAREPEARKKE